MSILYRSTRYLIGVTTALLLLVLSLVDADIRLHLDQARIEDNRDLVKVLSLTDLSLFTEARYTRHLSQADRHTPFQDHPLGLDHFPSGSLVTPPDTLR